MRLIVKQRRGRWSPYGGVKPGSRVIYRLFGLVPVWSREGRA